MKSLSELKRKASPERQLQTERETRQLLQQIAEQEAQKAIRAGRQKVLRGGGPESVQVSSSLSVEALDRYVFSLGAVLELHAVFPDHTVAIELVEPLPNEAESKAA